MKPCSKNRKRIVSFVTGILPDEDAEGLKTHLQNCAGCSAYWKEMTQLTDRLKAAEDRLPDAQPVSSFHSALAHRIGSLRKPTTLAHFVEVTQSWCLNSRLAHAALVLIVAATGAFLMFRSHPVDVQYGNPAPIPVAISSAPAKADLTVTLAGYHRVAESSLDALDDLLAQQARSISVAESFSISSLSKADPAN